MLMYCTVYMYRHAYINACLYVYLQTHAHTYIWTHTHTERGTGTHAHTHADGSHVVLKFCMNARSILRELGRNGRTHAQLVDPTVGV